MRHLKLLIYSCLLTVTLSDCHDAPDYKNDVYGNFDALCNIIDTRYCFFEAKDIDWTEISLEYRALLKPDMTQMELFEVCADLLDELKDGHVNLSSPFNTSYYRAWWSDYPQDFDLRTLQEHYLRFDYMQTSGISYKMLDDNIGYMYYPSFSSGISELSLDYILAYLHDADALILDIRDNGGGLLTNIGVLVSRFTGLKIKGGSICHKTGPGHNDFSEPYDFYYEPCDSRRINWDTAKPVFVLTNRSCFSSANDFVAVMKTLPNVKIVGARTGGGGGLPFSSELPVGWSLRFSSSPIYAPDGSITEFGIDPTQGYERHCTPEQLASGTDAILDFAIELARNEKNAAID